MARQAITIGDVSDQTGVNIETVRYYEKIGLLNPPHRSSGGRRLYDASAVRRLRFVRRARELGFSIADIRALLIAADGAATCGDVHALTVRHLDDVRAKIRDLRRLERTLAVTVQRCAQDDSADCPVIDVLARP